MQNYNEEMMKKILNSETAFADEVVADEVERVARIKEAEFAVDENVENGEVKYCDTCEYTMIANPNENEIADSSRS